MGVNVRRKKKKKGKRNGKKKKRNEDFNYLVIYQGKLSYNRSKKSANPTLNARSSELIRAPGSTAAAAATSWQPVANNFKYTMQAWTI